MINNNIVERTLAENIERKAKFIYGKNVKDCTNKELYYVIADEVMGEVKELWLNNRVNTNNEKEVYYFSMEFLMSRQLKNMLYNMEMTDDVVKACNELGIDFNSIVEEELEPAIFNGGLGQVSGCYVGSMSHIGMRGYGYGLRYKHGLFQQKIVNGSQVEEPDYWLEKDQSAWEVKREHRQYIIKFRGHVEYYDQQGNLKPKLVGYKPVMASRYDIPTVGYKNGKINYLGLWDADVPSKEMMTKYNCEYSRDALKAERTSITEICDGLYPNDSDYRGKELRLKQEYFLCSAGVQDIVYKWKDRGIDLKELHKYVSIHINDTHPTLCIPELMRILIDEEGLTWEEAWHTAYHTCSYTNHTIMQEALEVWREDMLKGLLPRVYDMILEINRRNPEYHILTNGNVNMAHLCICGSHTVNGVAELHTEILKDDTLNYFYNLNPSKFVNVTNGVNQHKWLEVSNPDLTEVITNTIGEQWKQDFAYIEELLLHDECLSEIERAKYNNKVRLAEYVKNVTGDIIDPSWMFDVQIKRIHAYKRQLMNILHVVYKYFEILDGNIPHCPKVHIFAGKAAASYHEAKCTITLINKVAKMINNDERANKYMKVVFIPNYNSSVAEVIIPAADLHEQISTASKEASGTSNMKFTMSGALLMTTLDGSNPELLDTIGWENGFTFGMDKSDVLELYRVNNCFPAKNIIENNWKFKRVMEALINGTIPELGNDGRDIYWTLMNNDFYFVWKDMSSYINAQDKASAIYRYEKDEWNKMCRSAIAKSDFFSSDRTVRQYCERVWKK